jgi:copper homeostasis protein
VDRILTGGHTQKAIDGLECLAKLVQLAGNRMTILACGGVNAKNVAAVVRQTGAQEVHFAARSMQESPMLFRVPGLYMGSRYEPDEYARKVTDVQLIREVIQAARTGN